MFTSGIPLNAFSVPSISSLLWKHHLAFGFHVNHLHNSFCIFVQVCSAWLWQTCVFRLLLLWTWFLCPVLFFSSACFLSSVNLPLVSPHCQRTLHCPWNLHTRQLFGPLPLQLLSDCGALIWAPPSLLKKGSEQPLFRSMLFMWLLLYSSPSCFFLTVSMHGFMLVPFCLSLGLMGSTICWETAWVGAKGIK